MLAPGIGQLEVLEIGLADVVVRAPRELVLLQAMGPRQGHTWSDGEDGLSFSYPVYRDLRDQNRVFSGLVAMFPLSTSVA